MTKQELRPCPFCGNDNPSIMHAYDLEYMRCFNCKGDFGWDGKVDKWSNRPLEDALRERAEELEDQLKTLDSNLDFLISENHMLDKKACEYKFRAEKAEAMVERMIGCVDKAKGSYFTLFRTPHVGSFLDDWNALVAEWKERE